MKSKLGSRLSQGYYATTQQDIYTCSRSNQATAGGVCYQLPLLSAAAATQWRSENQRRNRQKSGYKIVAVAVALLPWDIRSMQTSSYSLWNASKISRCQRIWQEHELKNKHDTSAVLSKNLSCVRLNRLKHTYLC